MSTTLPDRLRAGDATALLELAHATHPRALAVARAAGWSDDPESLLLDAYVALWLRRADAPGVLAEAWAFDQVVAYCATHASRRPHPVRTPRWSTPRWSTPRWSAARRVITRACAYLAGPHLRLHLRRSTSGG